MKTFILASSLVVATLAATPPASLSAREAANPVIVIDTAKGAIEIELLPKQAPKGVAHILELVEKNFYRGLRVHRMTSALVQMGDPQTRNVRLKNMWGTGGSGQVIGVSEINPLMKHTRGSVGLAYNGDPKFADSQFYIMKTNMSGLDGDYSIIGRVIKGITVVDRLQVEDVIKNIVIK